MLPPLYKTYGGRLHIYPLIYNMFNLDICTPEQILTLWTYDQIQLAFFTIINGLIDLNGGELNDNFIQQLITNISYINIDHPIHFMVYPHQFLHNSTPYFIEKWVLNFPFSMWINDLGFYKILIYRFVDTLHFHRYQSIILPQLSTWQVGDFVLTHQKPGSSPKLWSIQNFTPINPSATQIEDDWTFDDLLSQ